MNALGKRSVTGRGTTFMVLGIHCNLPTSASGGQLFSTGGDVLIQVMPSQAKLTSELHLFSPVHRYLATNRDSGGVINLGQFEAGSELVFGIWVRDTGHTFLMGPSSRNPDGLSHASIYCVRPGAAVVEFRDIWGEDSQDLERLLGEFEEAIAVSTQPIQPTLIRPKLVFPPFNSSNNLKYPTIKRAS